MTDSATIVSRSCDTQTDIRLDWRLRGACRTPQLAALMFDHRQVAAARTVCASCPVVEVCLQTALAEERTALYRYGVRGGLAPVERVRLADQLARPVEAGITEQPARSARAMAGPITEQLAACVWCWGPFAPRHAGHKFCGMSCSEASRRPAEARRWLAKHQQRVAELEQCA